MVDPDTSTHPVLLPRWRFVLAALLCASAAVLCVLAATRVPHIGLAFTRVGSVVQRRLAAPVAGTALRAGDEVIRVSALPDGPALRLRDEDLVEEPDYLIAWTSQDAFFARQDTLARIAHAPAQRIEVRRVASAAGVATDAVTVTATVRAARVPLSSLPWTFWCQLAIGAVGPIVGAWIWSLRPQDWSARFYALTGLGFMLAVFASAVYGTRELALSDPLFRWLSAVNHVGGLLFAGALCALFLVYPRPLVRPARAALLVPAAGVWWAVNTLQLTPDQRWFSFALPAALVLTLGAAMRQWRATRGDPADRALLRWLGATVLTSCTAIIALSTVPMLLDGTPAVSQGLGFAVILPMYLGLAIGLRQHRLFALDEWAFRLLFWGAAMAAVLLLDVWLVVWLGTQGAGAFAIAALLVLSTAPVRRWVWGRYHRRRDVEPVGLFRDVLRVSAAAADATDVERHREWHTLLGRWFAPLQTTPLGARDTGRDPHRAQILAQGRELSVPATPATAALVLSYADGGARVFTPQDAHLVDTACALLHVVEESRTALAEGMRRERVRIARDLHDTVSSPLLAGLRPVAGSSHDASQVEAMQTDIKRAVAGMRSVLTGAEHVGVPLRELLADLRYTTVSRLNAADVQVDWPLTTVQGDDALTGDQRHALTAFVHEVITNVIRHAAATRVSVDIRHAPLQGFTFTVTDDGRGIDMQRVSHGDGLTNLHARAADLGGDVRVRPRAAPNHGTEVILTTPRFGTVAA